MPLSELLTPSLWAVMPEALEPWFQTLAGNLLSGTPPATSPPPLKENPDYTLRDGVAVIAVSGLIRRTAGSFLWFSWEGQDRIRAAVAAAMADPAARAVLLSLDSPGGVAAGVKELADFIAAQTAKPIYAYADGTCCSAAYWLAAATGRVYAPLSANIGSIGVLHVHCDRSAANAAMGVRYTYITGGKWKASGNPDAPLSSADQAHLQAMVTSMHELFRIDVAAHLPVDADDPASWADGQVFLAGKAQELGLVRGIVADRDALITLINKEMFMNKEQLAQAHPELLAQLQAEARTEAEVSAAASKQQIVNDCLGMVRLVAGEASTARVEALLATGLTPEQVNTVMATCTPAAASPALQPPSPTATAEASSSSRETILAAIRQGTPLPVNTSSTIADTDVVQAAIDRMASMGV